MNSIADFNLNIEEDEILRLLGYKGSEPNEEVLCSVQEEIQKSKTYLKPQVWFEKILIKNIDKDKVILENSIVLEGEFISSKLKECDYIIVSLTTLGTEIDKIINASFEEGSYLKGMVIDNIGTAAIGYVGKIFWNSLVDNLKGTDIGISQRLSPGDNSWPIEEQKKIFDCFKGTDISVKLLDSCLMTPFKSITAIYGFGKNIGITKTEHICSECSMQNCNYRIDKNINITVKMDSGIVTLKAFKGQNLLKLLIENNIFIESPCSGKGICGKCKVLFSKGAGNWNKTDEKHLSLSELVKGIRLACTYKITDEIEITILSKEENINVLTEGKEFSIEVNPSLKKSFIKLTEPSLIDQRDDITRLRNELGNIAELSKLTINYNVLSNASEVMRKENFNVTAVLYKNALIALESGDTTNSLFGVSIDIGTTTIACYLIDMQSGETKDVTSQVNKQRAYGADVISRIKYTIDTENGRQVLKDSITNQINEMVYTLCNRNNLNLKSIYNMTIAGNTVMLQMLLGISCRNISMAPYIPAFTDTLEIPADELGINIGGIVSLLPGISGYVGSDIIADMLAVKITNSKKYSIILDLGTNGEIVLGNNKGIVACATAAGPAFEGANIKHGIGGINGAISKIDLSKQKIYETIGNKPPVGICGSGVLDAVSELLKHGVIDETGRMLDSDEVQNTSLGKRIILDNGMKQFLITGSSENENSIFFTQKDVREVQLAKASIYAGIKILMSEKGINYDEIDKVYIAGGFGNFMDISSSINIGMIPKELKGKICSIGNGAGIGAKMYLLCGEKEDMAQEIKNHTKYIELSSRTDFQEFFMDSIEFINNKD